MNDEPVLELPVFPCGDDNDAPVCGPTAYVSNEEAAIVSEMRAVKAEADEVRALRCETASDAEQAGLDHRLAELRALWSELADRRERAYRRKMIMLGHLPPDDEVPLL